MEPLNLIIGLSVSTIIIALLAVRIIYIRKSEKTRLIEAGFLTEKSRIRKRRRYYFVSHLHPAKTSFDIEKNLMIFEEVFGVSFESVELVNPSILGRVFFRPHGIRLIRDLTPKIAHAINSTRIGMMDVYLGEGTRGELCVDLEKAPTGFVSAPPGRGKTVLMKNISLSYLTNNSKGVVIIIDAKDSFYDLRKNPQIHLYDARSKESLSLALQHFRDIRKQIKEDEERLRQNDLTPRHWNHIRCSRPGLLALAPTLIICDEAFFYTQLRKGDPLLQEKTEIVDSLEDFVRRGRSFGIATFFGFQDAHAENFFIARDMFHIRIYSRTNSALSKSLIESEHLTSHRLKESGLFFADIQAGVKNAGQYRGFIRVPYQKTREEL
jgi:hypothetical protein